MIKENTTKKKIKRSECKIIIIIKMYSYKNIPQSKPQKYKRVFNTLYGTCRFYLSQYELKNKKILCFNDLILHFTPRQNQILLKMKIPCVENLIKCLIFLFAAQQYEKLCTFKNNLNSFVKCFKELNYYYLFERFEGF